MNEMTNLNTIWKPAVRSTEVPCENSKRSQVQHFTRTSLARNFGSESNLEAASARRQLNERILNASQLFNNTPKPFVKQWSLSESSTTTLKQAQQQQRQQRVNFVQTNSFQIDDKQQVVGEQKMSPKLVHQQYNSPIDLYSMNNIRKTIEAQSEMIAPGVKGINFMKADAPINKNSEVLKLIKEQEEEEAEQRRRQQQLGSQANANNASQLTSSSANHQRLQYAAERVGFEPTRTANLPSAQLPMQSTTLANAPPSESQSTGGSGAPKCFECGQPIVGPFAKLQDRFIHPQCFNCSTCGTSLKNSGYFTISDKLYCDIHARQVANVMRLNYNFEPNKQAVVSNQQEPNEHHRPEPSTRQILVEKKPATTSLIKAQQPPGTTIEAQTKAPPISAHIGPDQGGHCSLCCSAMGNQATTISTMFRGVGHHCQQCNNHCSCNRRSEIRWTWRPAGNHDNCQHQKLDSDNMVSSTSSSSIKSSSRAFSETKGRLESRLVTSMASGNRSTSSMNGNTGDRVPVCCHCHCQIFGPYILAGNSAWCKPCSQKNFLCNSCNRSLLNIGFIEDNQTGKYNCEHCFETHLTPVCSKCNSRIKGDCLNALGKQWHPTCFVCGHCRGPFGNSSFYLEDNVPYCERDWNLLFTTKCYACGYPIQVGDKWIEALERNYHSDCFRCTGCQVKLEGATFYCKDGKPYCRMHAM